MRIKRLFSLVTGSNCGSIKKMIRGHLESQGITPEITMNNKSVLLHTYSNGKIQTTDNTKCWKNKEQKELLFIASGNIKWHSHFGRHFGSFLQNRNRLLLDGNSHAPR